MLLALCLAGCGAGATATIPSPVAPTVASASPSATIVRAPILTAVPTLGAVPTRTSLATPARSTTPVAGATATRGATTRAVAPATRTAAATDDGVTSVAVRLGQSAILPEQGLTMRFASVTNDSRCPRSQEGVFVACAQAGEATIVVEAARGGQGSALTLTIPGLTDNTAQRPDNPKTFTVFEGYRIQLASLEPQPTVSGAAIPGEYIATLLVSAAP